MSRRRRAEVRVVAPEPRFGSEELARFINKVMTKGKKSVAQRIVYKALESVVQDTKRGAMEVFDQAINNTQPLLMVKPRRVGGATYQVPIEVPIARGKALAIRWIITAARSRAGTSMTRKLASELIDASRDEGAAVRRKEDMHRMAEANRAFVHYRW
ncbi:30S ribosomal protein S7 [SAR202 cluster bacterium AC-409-J13_OGT_754m]|nr:30S ribosomal protein S7 [SAR202 cluster bacterium AC-409-J13_OGT_754m]